jgi:DNA mismatch repair protein MutL
MGKILQLDKDVVNKIAAGEVVERPASVVKELVDNSLDAGATEIEIEIENGGASLIKIFDNGGGIGADDLLLALAPHATSKLNEIDDLLSLRTLGFRGEALSSISSVARLTLQSKQQSATTAWQVALSDEGQYQTTKTVLSGGTVVSVADLFYNVPARKKFLKQATTEFNHIMDLITRFALIYPGVAWRLSHNGREQLNCSVTDIWFDRVADVLGKDKLNDWQSFNWESEKIKISGFVSKPNHWQNRRNHQYIYVNHRPITSPLIHKAIIEGIGHLLPFGSYPAYLIHLEVPGDAVDVNVHPRKSEVKFVDEHLVFSAVRQVIKQNMLQTEVFKTETSAAPMFKKNFSTSQSSFNNSSAKTFNSSGGQQNFASSRLIYDPIKLKPVTLSLSDSASETEQNQPAWRLIGQWGTEFILVEAQNSLMIIDQHALAEGLLYLKLKRASETSTEVRKQSLLIPARLELSAWQENLLLEFKDILVDLGFEVENFGGRTYLVQAVPADLAGAEASELLLGILNDLALEDRAMEIEKKREQILKYASCRGAIKFGEHLNEAVMKSLVQEMFDLNAHTCAHGRPIYWLISEGEAMKKFER